jgi:predicted nucleotidyltransferase
MQQLYSFVSLCLRGENPSAQQHPRNGRLFDRFQRQILGCARGASVVHHISDFEKAVCPMQAALRHILEQFRRGLKTIYGARLAEVVPFGSQARNEAWSDSDIDVLVVLKGPVDPNLEIPRVSPLASGLSLRHDVVISCVYVSEHDFRADESPLLLNVRREGVAVAEQILSAHSAPLQ